MVVRILLANSTQLCDLRPFGWLQTTCPSVFDNTGVNSQTLVHHGSDRSSMTTCGQVGCVPFYGPNPPLCTLTTRRSQEASQEVGGLSIRHPLQAEFETGGVWRPKILGPELVTEEPWRTRVVRMHQLTSWSSGIAASCWEGSRRWLCFDRFQHHDAQLGPNHISWYCLMFTGWCDIACECVPVLFHGWEGQLQE